MNNKKTEPSIAGLIKARLTKTLTLFDGRTVPVYRNGPYWVSEKGEYFYTNENNEILSIVDGKWVIVGKVAEKKAKIEVEPPPSENPEWIFFYVNPERLMEIVAKLRDHGFQVNQRNDLTYLPAWKNIAESIRLDIKIDFKEKIVSYKQIPPLAFKEEKNAIEAELTYLKKFALELKMKFVTPEKKGEKGLNRFFSKIKSLFS